MSEARGGHSGCGGWIVLCCLLTTELLSWTLGHLAKHVVIIMGSARSNRTKPFGAGRTTEAHEIHSNVFKVVKIPGKFVYRDSSKAIVLSETFAAQGDTKSILKRCH